MRTLSHILLASSMFFLCLYSCKKKFDEDAISQSLKNKISSHCFSTDNIQKTSGGYIVEGDILLTESFLDQPSTVQTIRVGRTEQFQTNFIVSHLPRTLSIDLSSQFPASYSSALDEAIRRYNSENLLLHFVRASSNADIEITNGIGFHLAISGFPDGNGEPYHTIKLNPVMIGNNSSTTFINYLATIITHEIGHCIGFRHTDYMDRSYSCGGRIVKESCGDAGAVLIPGTNSIPENGSWMLTCISANENRPFTDNDKIALHYIY